MIWSFDPNRKVTTARIQIATDFRVIYRFIHTDVEKLLSSFRVVHREQERTDQIFHVDKIPFYRIPVGVQHDWDGLGPCIFISLSRADQVAPTRSTKHIFSKRKLVLEIILFHDPG